MNTAGLEWFGPPERNTLRPLCVVLPFLERVCESLCVLVCVRVNLCSSGRAPFYMYKGSTYTERGPDRSARRCIINYTLAFNVSDLEILSSAFMCSF